MNENDPLYTYQEKFLDRLPRRAFLLWPCGRGKTRTACEWAKRLPKGQTLIVCPKGLLTQWNRQVEKWGLQNALIISKETFKKVTKPFDNLIVDEADFFLSANFTSQLSKHLRAYLKTYDPNVLMMSATLYRSSPLNVYTAATLLNKPVNYYNFRRNFMNQISIGPRLVWIPKKDVVSQEKLRKFILDITETISPEDDFEIPTHTFEEILIDEDDQQRRTKENNQELHPMARFVIDHRAEALNVNKFEKIDSLCRSENKVIVVCRYLEQLDALNDYLTKKGHIVFKIHGQVPNRQEVVDAANTSTTAVVLVQADTVQGYELPTFRLMVFASMSYSTYAHTQVLGRNDRVNALAKNTYIYLLAGECDKAVKKSIDKNEDFDPLVYYRYNQ